MRKQPENPLIPGRLTGGENPPVQDEAWENCKGQCGFTPWCRECMVEKERLLEEKLNREGRPDDKKE